MILPQARSALIEFFRHHGAWSPGVKLFRRLQFRAKAGLVSAAFCIPLVVLGWNFFVDKSTAIEFSSKERDGVAYLREVLPLASQAIQLRTVVAQAAVKSALSPQLAAARAAAAARLKQLETVDQRLGPSLQTGKAIAKIRQTEAAASQGQGTFVHVLELETAHVAAIDALVSHVVDRSHMVLDPDLDTFYLMNGALMHMPDLLESVGVLHSVALAIKNGQESNIDLVKLMAGAGTQGDLLEPRVAAALEKVESVHPAIKTKLRSAEALKHMHAFHDLVAKGMADAAQLDKAGNAAIDGLTRLQRGMVEELDILLQARVSGALANRNITAAIIALCLTAGVYLFYSFYLVTHGGLREVQKHLEAMTSGDLTTRPKPWGKDEAASLMDTLAAMQASLRNIVSKVRGSSESLVNASTDIASASVDLSSRTEQSAANLQKSAASMEELSGTVKHTARNVVEVAQVATVNSQAAERGGVVIRQVVATMQDIHKSSSKIREIIGTIDGIAFQTNILALNAAVEAARAGGQGRGFAVVASEVRSLAQRSAGAAKEIKALISGSVDLIAAGTKVVVGAGETMQDLVTNAQRMHSLLSEISAAASEQSLGINQVGESVNELDRATQQNAALVEQTAAAAQALKEQALDLATEVAAFRLPA